MFIAGNLAGIKQLYLAESKQIMFKIDNYAVIGGYPVETIQLITYALIVLLVVTFSLALTYRRLFTKISEEEIGV